MEDTNLVNESDRVLEEKIRMKEHKARMKKNQKGRRQEELNGVLLKVKECMVTEDKICDTKFDFSSLYQSIPKLGALLNESKDDKSNCNEDILLLDDKYQSECEAEDSFWIGIPPTCTPNLSKLDSTIASDALLKGEESRQRKFRKKLETKLRHGNITEQQMNALLENYGRKNDNEDGMVGSFSLLNSERGVRKKQQVENFASIFEIFGNKLKTVVDFGCGSGNLCLALASYYRNTRFVFVDQNNESLKLLSSRAKEGDLDNVVVMQYSFNFENLARFQEALAKQNNTSGDFDLGIGLHCCGRFTDMVMEVCRLNKADCIVSPCCNGKMGQDYQQENHRVTSLDQEFDLYPRSTFFSNLITRDEYFSISRSADDLGNYEAKCAVEYDRSRWAEENNYHVWLLKMNPLTASPKHHVLFCRYLKGSSFPLPKLF